MAHHTVCSIAAPIVEASRLALAAAKAAMCVPTKKGFCNIQHLEGGKTAASQLNSVAQVPERILTSGLPKQICFLGDLRGPLYRSMGSADFLLYCSR